jgi:hypothetical protein
MSLTNIILSRHTPKPIGAALLKYVWVPRTTKMMLDAVEKMSEQGLSDFLDSYKESEPWLKEIISKLVYGEVKRRNTIRRSNGPLYVKTV